MISEEKEFVNTTEEMQNTPDLAAETAGTAEEDIREAEIAALKERNEALLRVAAEYENYRKRTSAELAARWEDAGAAIIKQILPLYDVFGKAAKSEEGDLDSMKKGITMLYKGFEDFLHGLGVTEIGSVGEAFDPNIHEALISAADENLPENAVAEVFETGYRIGDRVLRPAKVKVANP